MKEFGIGGYYIPIPIPIPGQNYFVIAINALADLEEELSIKNGEDNMKHLRSVKAHRKYHRKLHKYFKELKKIVSGIQKMKNKRRFECYGFT